MTLVLPLGLFPWRALNYFFLNRDPLRNNLDIAITQLLLGIVDLPLALGLIICVVWYPRRIYRLIINFDLSYDSVIQLLSDALQDFFIISTSLVNILLISRLGVTAIALKRLQKGEATRSEIIQILLINIVHSLQFPIVMTSTLIIRLTYYRSANLVINWNRFLTSQESFE